MAGAWGVVALMLALLAFASPFAKPQPLDLAAIAARNAEKSRCVIALRHMGEPLENSVECEEEAAP